MLPGFRFLFAAILLSTSILVFGLGAAALLRATHEQYVSNPSWRNGPQEQVFAQAAEPAQPVLAVLRAEPDATAPAPSLRDQVPTIALPASEPEQVAAVTSEAAAPSQTIASPADTTAAEPAKVETTAETTTGAATAAPADTLTPADTTASVPETKPAATASAPAQADAGPAPAMSTFDIASARMAALNPATTAWKDPPAKARADASTPESKAAKPRAHRIKKRHRIVRRPPPPVQQLDPFGQPQPTLAATTTRARQ